MRGFIDDSTDERDAYQLVRGSQSAFMRGFIDDNFVPAGGWALLGVSIRVHARLHR